MNYHLLAGSLLLAAITGVSLNACASSMNRSAPQTRSASIQEKLVELETSSGGRIGLFAVNTANNSSTQYRSEERFPMCSTFKAMAVSAILKKSMTDSGLLKQRIFYNQKDVTHWGYAPITEKHIHDGMTVEELCVAAIQHSDNGVNLLIKKLDGPQGVTSFLRSIGDSTSRLDRWEPELNSAIPGDLRDTTTPAAIGASLQKIVFGDVLGKPQRQKLEDWLKGNKTGDARIRAGVPKGWLVGDKTGTCHYGTTNDIAIIWPPNGAPVVVIIYFTQSDQKAAPRDDIIASVTRLLVNEVR